MTRTLAAALTLMALAVAAPASAQAPPSPPRTIVTFSFDDAIPSQLQVVPWLEAKGMNATFYVNSGKVGRGTGHFSWDQLENLAAAGHEVGGHTIDHVRLTDEALTPQERRRQICDDRADLIARGFEPPVSFAYPHGLWDDAIEALVADCGYTSARTTTTWDPDEAGESLPPRELLALRGETVLQSSSFDFFREITQKAERSTGGWLLLVIHDVCTRPCASPELEEHSADPEALRLFIDWLADREHRGTIVRTVGETLEMLTPPPPAPLCANGLDDDGDGTTDHPADPGCTSTTDDDETDPPALPPPVVVRPVSPAETAPVVLPATFPPAGPPVAGAATKVVRAAPTLRLAGLPGTRRLERTATLRLRATVASEQPIARVRFLLDGRTLALDRRAPYTATLRARLLRPGLHRLSVVAVDRAGGVGRTNRTIRVLRQPR